MADNAAGKMLKVTLVRSTIGFNKNQAKPCGAWGCGGSATRWSAGHAGDRGMIHKVRHLVRGRTRGLEP
jgi:hypothetical protein